MAKTITISFDGEDYTLEFTRRIVKEMESAGFTPDLPREKPMTAYPMLFSYAFKCHHRRLKEEVIDRIYKNLKGKEDFFDMLSDMYIETYETLFEEPDEDAEKNAVWKKNW